MIQSEGGFQTDHMLKTLTDEINMAHEHEDLAVKAAQAARETFARERRLNRKKALFMEDQMAKALGDAWKVRKQVVVQKAVITKITSDRVAKT